MCRIIINRRNGNKIKDTVILRKNHHIVFIIICLCMYPVLIKYYFEIDSFYTS